VHTHGALVASLHTPVHSHGVVDPVHSHGSSYSSSSVDPVRSHGSFLFKSSSLTRHTGTLSRCLLLIRILHTGTLSRCLLLYMTRCSLTRLVPFFVIFKSIRHTDLFRFNPTHGSFVSPYRSYRHVPSIGMQPIPPLSPSASIRLSITVLRSSESIILVTLIRSLTNHVPFALRSSESIYHRFDPTIVNTAVNDDPYGSLSPGTMVASFDNDIVDSFFRG